MVILAIFLSMSITSFGQNTSRYDDPLYQTAGAIKELRGLFKSNDKPKDDSKKKNKKEKEGKNGQQKAKAGDKSDAAGTKAGKKGQNSRDGFEDSDEFLYGIETNNAYKNGEKNNASSTKTQKADDDVTLVVSGEGANKDEATKMALRSAIEQTYGVFVSASTEILNDNLVKNEIATIASGNIKSYKELGSITTDDGQVSVTLQAVVSIGKLVSYVESHGGSAELAGQVYMMEMNMRKLNKENELKAYTALIHQINKMPEFYDYSVVVDKTPKELNYNFKGKNYHGYSLTIFVTTYVNKNFDNCVDLCRSTFSSIGLSKEERAQYDATNSSYSVRFYGTCRPWLEDIQKNSDNYWKSFERNHIVWLRNNLKKLRFVYPEYHIELECAYDTIILNPDTMIKEQFNQPTTFGYNKVSQWYFKTDDDNVVPCNEVWYTGRYGSFGTLSGIPGATFYLRTPKYITSDSSPEEGWACHNNIWRNVSDLKRLRDRIPNDENNHDGSLYTIDQFTIILSEEQLSSLRRVNVNGVHADHLLEWD